MKKLPLTFVFILITLRNSAHGCSSTDSGCSSASADVHPDKLTGRFARQSGDSSTEDSEEIDGIDDGLLSELSSDPEVTTTEREREEVTPNTKTVSGFPDRPELIDQSRNISLEQSTTKKPFDVDNFDQQNPTTQQLPDTKVEPLPDTEVKPLPDTKVKPLPDTEVEPLPDTKPKKKKKVFVCMIGGYGGPGQGIFSGFTHLLHRQFAPPLPDLPQDFPMGRSGVFSTMLNNSMFVCSPGTIVTRSLFSGPGFFLQSFIQPPPIAVPGGCMKLDKSGQQWQNVGQPMNQFRDGSSFIRMGNFFVSSGGRSERSPGSASIEVMDSSNPDGWRPLSRLSLPHPTYDHCSVALNNTAMFLTGGFSQESMAAIMDMQNQQVLPQEPLRQPRRQHACHKATINGHEGVIVAGGMSPRTHSAMSSVEFYDLNKAKWFSLGNMNEPRAFPAIMVLANKLVVAGGQNEDQFGQEVVLDSMEVLKGRSWTRLNNVLPQPRSRFSTITLSETFFPAPPVA